MIFPLFDRNPTTRFPLVTIALIVANLGIAAWAFNLGEREFQSLVFEYGMVPKRLSKIDSGQPVAIRIEQEEVVFQTQLSTQSPAVLQTLLTMMFLHGGWLHVIGNVWMLWIFGNNIEDRLGHFGFSAFYLLGGVLSCLCQWIVSPESQLPVVGASGAVWALLGGYAVTYPKAKVFSIVFIGIPLLLNLPAALVIAVFFAFDLVLGVEMLRGGPVEAVAYWAHIGGCIIGVVLVPLLGMGASPTENDWQSETDRMFDFSDTDRTSNQPPPRDPEIVL